jgi:hypothetical protein
MTCNGKIRHLHAHWLDVSAPSCTTGSMYRHLHAPLARCIYLDLQIFHSRLNLGNFPPFQSNKRNILLIPISDICCRWNGYDDLYLPASSKYGALHAQRSSVLLLPLIEGGGSRVNIARMWGWLTCGLGSIGSRHGLTSMWPCSSQGEWSRHNACP